MPPKFPHAERMELQTPPLELVVCQLRFPTVLALEANQPPDEFQRRLRTDYPATRRRPKTVMVVDGVPQPAASFVWVFEDRESRWTVALGSDFLALETKRYRRFDEFIHRFLGALRVAQEIYPIALRERLGLRYVNQISREKQPALPEGWVSRVRPEVIALRAIRDENEPQMTHQEVRFAFGDRILALRSLFADRGFPGIREDELILDFDCYIEKRADLEGVDGLLGEFRQIVYNAFRWSLGDLIQFFEPAQTEPQP